MNYTIHLITVLKHVLTLVCMITAANAFSQSVKADLQKINNGYEKSEALSMNITYSVFASHSAAAPVEVSRGAYKKSGKNYLTDVSGNVSIQNERYLINVDDDHRKILVADPRKFNTGFDAVFDFDSLLVNGVKSKIEARENGVTIITLSFTGSSGSEFEKMEIQYSKSNYLITKLTLFYAEAISMDDEEKLPKQKPRMEIRFENITTNPVFTAQEFSEKHFFTAEGSRLVNSAAYKKYQLVDQRIKK